MILLVSCLNNIVQVHYAPGGQSSFSLGGDDNSRYEPVTKKKENVYPSYASEYNIVCKKY